METTAQADRLELEPTSPEVKQYHRAKLILNLYGLAITVAFLAAMALLFGMDLDRGVRDLAGANRWARLAVLALCYGAALEMMSLPIDFYSGYILEHRYRLSNQTLFGWIKRRLKGYLLAGVVGLIFLVGLYAFLWYSGPLWWLWAAAGWLAANLVLGQLVPIVVLPFFYKVTPVEAPELRERFERLSAGTGLSVAGVYRLHLSEETKKANAMLAGLGRSRRIMLGDTLLDNFTTEEIEVVFAHEVGHHVHRHMAKRVALGVVMSILVFWLIDALLQGAAPALGYPSFRDPAALPLLLLIPLLFGLLAMPAENALSRFFERQCDRYALERTRTPDAYRSAFIKLARLNKADADPHPLKVWLFDDHPPIRERLDLANDAG